MSPESAAPGAPEQPRETAPVFEAPTIEALNACLDGYEVTRLIAVGGMGAVYEARQPRLERNVAIKVLPGEAGSDFGFPERFRREARSMAQLHHTHIVTVYDFGETPSGLLYFVMEYVEGQSLYERMQAGPLHAAEACPWIRQVASGLEHAHQHGVVHGDVKPSNILISKAGVAKLTDFGLAHRQHAASTEGGSSEELMGTPDYVAPELLRRTVPPNAGTDLFALGVVLYEMLAGRLPARDDYQPPSRHGHPRWIDPLVARLCHPDPARRFQSAGEFLAALDVASRSAAPFADVRIPPRQQRIARAAGTDSRPPKFPGWAKVAILVAVAIAVGVGIRMRNGSSGTVPGAATAAGSANSGESASTSPATSTEPAKTPDPIAADPTIGKPGDAPFEDPFASGTLRPATPTPELRPRPVEPSIATSSSSRPATPPVPREAEPFAGLLERPKPDAPKFAGIIPSAARSQTEFMRRLAEFEGELDAQAARPRREALGKLCANYVSALERALQEAARAGDSDGAMALREERSRAEAHDLDAIKNRPAAPRLAPLREIFQREVARLESATAVKAIPVHEKFEAGLKSLQLGLFSATDGATVRAITAARDEIAKTLNGWGWLTVSPAVAGSPAANPATSDRGTIEVFWIAHDLASFLLNGTEIEPEVVDHGVANFQPDNILRVKVEVKPGDVIGFAWKSAGGNPYLLTAGKQGNRITFSGRTMGWGAVDGVPPPGFFTDPKFPSRRPDMINDTRELRRYFDRFSRVTDCREGDYSPIIPSKQLVGGLRRVITPSDVN